MVMPISPWGLGESATLCGAGGIERSKLA